MLRRLSNDRSWPASDRSPAAVRSNFGLFRHLKDIIDLNPEIAHGAFQLRISEQ